MWRILVESGPVSTHGSPPGRYWYQIGTTSGPRPGTATDSAATCGWDRNCSRSSRLTGMGASLGTGSGIPGDAGRRVPAIRRALPEGARLVHRPGGPATVELGHEAVEHLVEIVPGDDAAAPVEQQEAVAADVVHGLDHPVGDRRWGPDEFERGGFAGAAEHFAQRGVRGQALHGVEDALRAVGGGVGGDRAVQVEPGEVDLGDVGQLHDPAQEVVAVG